MDGQIGFLVERETGGIAVRLDRKHEERLVPYSPQQWLIDTEPRLTPIQHARVAYEADRALRSVLGEYGIPEWQALKEPARLAWLRGIPSIQVKGTNGKPDTHVSPSAIRMALFQAVRTTLRDA